MKDATKLVSKKNADKIVTWVIEVPESCGKWYYEKHYLDGTLADAKEFALQLFKDHKESIRKQLAEYTGFEIGFWIDTEYSEDYLDGDWFQVTFQYEHLAIRNKSNAWTIKFSNDWAKLN